MLRWLFMAIVLLGATRSVLGEFYFSERTLGQMMAQSDCVVRAVIIRVKNVSPINPGVDRIQLDLDVRETFAGPPTVKLDFWMDAYKLPDAAKATEYGTEYLFFLESSAQSVEPSISATAPKLCSNFFAPPIPLTSKRLTSPLISDDLRRLTSVDDVLKEARRLANMKRPTGGTMVLLPNQLKKQLGMGDYDWLEVGLNEETFHSARQWIVSSDPQMQWCGAEVLIKQNSPANAKALQQFAWFMSDAPRYGPWARERTLRTLGSWGVVDLPPLVRASPIFDVHRRAAWLSLAACLLVPLVCISLVLRRRARVITAAWSLIVCGAMTLSVRSYWPQDAITWGNIDVALERGRLYVEHQDRATAGFRSPLFICQPAELLRYQNADFMSVSDRLNNLGEHGDFEMDSFSGRYRLFGGWRRDFQALRGPIWSVPLWPFLMLLICPNAVLLVWRWTRRRRSRNARGFPITTVNA